MKFKFKNYKKGFTLIELLVSFAILATGISVSINLITQSLRSSTFLKNQTTASYLAVEGIELIKNKRDENLIRKSAGAPGASWDDVIKNECKGGKGCYADAISGVITKCLGAKCPALKYNQAKNYYNYSSGADSIFIRKISLSDVPGNGADEKEILSEISWEDRFGDHNYVLRVSIFNWR